MNHTNPHSILEALKAREPIFHHPEQYGSSKQDLLDMTCDEFWEVGASGNIYTREFVITTLLERYADPNYKDEWKTQNFKLTPLSDDHYLLTYELFQGLRFTRRSTIWRLENGSWKILYHQGTVVEDAEPD